MDGPQPRNGVSFLRAGIQPQVLASPAPDNQLLPGTLLYIFLLHFGAFYNIVERIFYFLFYIFWLVFLLITVRHEDVLFL